MTDQSLKGKRLLIVPADIEVLFWSKADQSAGEDACWPWLFAIQSDGYGQLNWKSLGGHCKVHVVAWELFHGREIPRDPETGRKLDVDHICHNRDLTCPGGKICLHRRCCNPHHLEVKSTGSNRDAADHPRKRGAFKEQCNHGHPLDEVNTGYKIRTKPRAGETRIRPPERYCKRCERTKQCMFPDCSDVYHDHTGTPWPAGNGAQTLLNRYNGRLK